MARTPPTRKNQDVINESGYRTEMHLSTQLPPPFLEAGGRAEQQYPNVLSDVDPANYGGIAGSEWGVRERQHVDFGAPYLAQPWGLHTGSQASNNPRSFDKQQNTLDTPGTFIKPVTHSFQADGPGKQSIRGKKRV